MSLFEFANLEPNFTEFHRIFLKPVTGIAQASSVKVLQTNLKSNLAEESPDDQAPDHLMTINISTFC